MMMRPQKLAGMRTTGAVAPSLLGRTSSMACRRHPRTNVPSGGISRRRCQRPGDVLCASSKTASEADQKTKTQQIFEEIESRTGFGAQANGAGGSTSYEGMKRVDNVWKAIRNQPTGGAAGPAPEFVKESKSMLPGTAEYDIVMCGGTLGIFIATVLQLKGLKVAIVERGPLAGRSQDWNISWKELQEVVDLGVLSEEEAKDAVSIEFNPIRAVFNGAEDKAVWTKDVLNLGVCPAKLVPYARKRFEEAGGVVLERCGVSGITVFGNGAKLDLEGAEQEAVTGRVVLDCMGHGSPITRQLRWGTKPDGMCLVVGSCSRGPWPDNGFADLIATTTPLQAPDAAVTNLQYFWEAFPAGSHPQDRTTYMFSYLDAEPHRPSLEALLEDYWRLMPEYQGVSLDDLEVQRILYGFFPTFRNSPLKPGWNRVLQVGDASGIQSPLSFGGFGALTRHMKRLTDALHEALECDAVSKEELGLINAYNPGLSGAWMLQRAMSVRPGEKQDPQFVNKLLSTNFDVMNEKGEETLKPFLQDVIQFRGLASTLAGQMAKAPLFTPEILTTVGAGPILDWTQHFVTMGVYTALTETLEDRLMSMSEGMTPKDRYRLRRTLEAWRFGAGLDYKP